MPPRRQQPPPAQPGDDQAQQYRVTGPTSALTSFLREQGITGSIHRRPQPPAATNANATAGPSTSTTTTVTVTTTTTTTSSPASSSASGSRKRKAPAGGKKKKGNDDGDDDDTDGFLIGGVKEAPKKGRYDDRMPGSIAICAECGKKFTVTKYTTTNPSGPGLLCSPCANETVDDMASRALKPKTGPKPKKRALKALEEREIRPVMTLQMACIAVIGKHIDHVEGDAFGHIGPKNLDRIAKIVSKHRALSSDNLDLFLGVGHREVSLYDCTNLTENDLKTIAVFCPHLERIKLNMCGRADDAVMKAWGEKLKELKYLTLYAPYLVTAKGWKAFFESFTEGHELEGFGLRQSARFDDHSLRALVTHHPHLYNLQLSELGRLNDVSLEIIHPLKFLTTLDISAAGVLQGSVLTDDAVVALLENVGKELVELNLSKNHLLTDRTLLEGIQPHCPRLRSLSLRSVSLLESTGVEALFKTWTVNSGLTHLDLHRCSLLLNDSLTAFLAHSGHSIKWLDLHSVDELEDTVLFDLSKKAKELEWLDVSFVRSVDNFVVKALLDECEKLKTLFLHGNNRVTDDCPHKKGVSIRGRENAMHVEL